MANDYYLGAGFIADDSVDSPPAVANTYMLTAGLPANDYTPPAGTEYRMIYHNHYQQMKVV